jgi:hypothetical protein
MSDLGREPTEIQPADLGSVFSQNSSRAAGLGGLLQRQQPGPAPRATPPTEETPDPQPARPSSTRTRRPRQSRATRKAPAEKAGARGQIVAYVPVSLKARLEQACSGRESYTTVAMTAIDTHREALQGHWTESRPSSSAFIGWHRSRRRNDEPMVPVTLRMVPQDEETLDRLWEEAGAPNRSAYVEAALDLHLPTTG